MTTEHDDFDPFAAGGWNREPFPDDRQQSAADPLSLFQQYIAAGRETDAAAARDDSAEYDLAFDRMIEAEKAIVACSGTVALALKTFFLFRHEHAKWAPEPYVRIDEDFNDPLFLSALRDAADLVPEIAELTAPIFHEDAKLIDADMEVAWARLVSRDDDQDARSWSISHGADGERARSKWRFRIKLTLALALDTIARTEAKTPRGAAIKAKHEAEECAA
jgi:hypothetical protein